MTVMMVSFMHCCTSMLKLRHIAAALVIMWLGIGVAHAENIDVRKAEIRFTDEGYQLAADFNINLSFYVEQALIKGITLNFVSEFRLTRSRWYWLNEVVAKSEQTTKLSYSALTRQYRISRGSLFQNFDSLEEALIVLGHQTSNPITSDQLNSQGGYITSLLKRNPDYSAFVRMQLDVTQLPKPLQVNALAGDDWNLDSAGYYWTITPAAIAAARSALP
jgi:hypothetical protein